MLNYVSKSKKTFVDRKSYLIKLGNFSKQKLGSI